MALQGQKERKSTLTTNSDDSDIEEVHIVQPTMPGIIKTKRRKSSPQLDPIPDYTPTPLHILEKRARLNLPTYSHNNNDSQNSLYDPLTPAYGRASATSHLRQTEPVSSTTAESRPNVVDSTQSISSSDCNSRGVQQKDKSSSTTANSAQIQRKTSDKPKSNLVPSRVSAFSPRPVTGSLIEAVARRRASLTDESSTQSSSVKTPNKQPSNQPVMWTPRMPSEIPETAQKTSNIEQQPNYKSPVKTKERVAHKPTTPKNSTRPRYPLGNARNVPSNIRNKYLDIIIDEYLSTGHPEQESYDEAVKEEQALAIRAANRNIYINLIAGLKRKIRERAGLLKISKIDSSAPCVSHDQILTGKVVGTFSIEKRKKSITDPNQLTERELYARLQRYILPKEELLNYGYPCENPDNPDVALIPSKDEVTRQPIRVEPASTYTCERCGVIYKVNDKRMPIDTGKCIFHPGRLWNERVNKSLEKRYSCCKGDISAGGCNSSKYHVQKGELDLESYLGFVKTQPKPHKDPYDHGIYALDCEMCYTTLGLELTRVTVVNQKFETVYEKLVKPNNFILDYNTKYSGLSEGDLELVDTTLLDVQKDLLAKFSSKSILIGHSLDSDMKALKLIHGTVIDTAYLFPHKRGLPFKRGLKTLSQEFLRVIIQDDTGHDSKEDAISSLKLVFWKLKTDVPPKLND